MALRPFTVVEMPPGGAGNPAVVALPPIASTRLDRSIITAGATNTGKSSLLVFVANFLCGGAAGQPFAVGDGADAVTTHLSAVVIAGERNVALVDAPGIGMPGEAAALGDQKVLAMTLMLGDTIVVYIDGGGGEQAITTLARLAEASARHAPLARLAQPRVHVVLRTGTALVGNAREAFDAQLADQPGQDTRNHERALARKVRVDGVALMPEASEADLLSLAATGLPVRGGALWAAMEKLARSLLEPRDDAPAGEAARLLPPHTLTAGADLVAAYLRDVEAAGFDHAKWYRNQVQAAVFAAADAAGAEHAPAGVAAFNALGLLPATATAEGIVIQRQRAFGDAYIACRAMIRMALRALEADEDLINAAVQRAALIIWQAVDAEAARLEAARRRVEADRAAAMAAAARDAAKREVSAAALARLRAERQRAHVESRHVSGYHPHRAEKQHGSGNLFNRVPLRWVCHSCGASGPECPGGGCPGLPIHAFREPDWAGWLARERAAGTLDASLRAAGVDPAVTPAE